MALSVGNNISYYRYNLHLKDKESEYNKCVLQFYINILTCHITVDTSLFLKLFKTIELRLYDENFNNAVQPLSAVTQPS